MAQLNYNHLRYFWAVAHAGNLTRTAEALNVSQSALSIQIQKLEAQLGHALFERRGKQLVLTEAGRIALDYADAIFTAGEELLGTLGGQDGTTRRVLRVGAVSTLSRNFQIAFLQPLLGRADVEVVVQSGNLGTLLPRLEAHRLDVVLTTVVPPRDAATPWVAHRIAEQPVGLVATPQRAGPEPSLAELLKREPVLLPTVESIIRSGFDALCDRLGLRPRIAAEVDDMAMLRLLARQDLGVAVVPPIVVKDELDAGLLVEVAWLPDLHETFYAVTLARRFPNPLLRSLLVADGLAEAVGDSPAEATIPDPSDQLGPR